MSVVFARSSMRTSNSLALAAASITSEDFHLLAAWINDPTPTTLPPLSLSPLPSPTTPGVVLS